MYNRSDDNDAVVLTVGIDGSSAERVIVTALVPVRLPGPSVETATGLDSSTRA